MCLAPCAVCSAAASARRARSRASWSSPLSERAKSCSCASAVTVPVRLGGAQSPHLLLKLHRLLARALRLRRCVRFPGRGGDRRVARDCTVGQGSAQLVLHAAEREPELVLALGREHCHHTHIRPELLQLLAQVTVVGTSRPRMRPPLQLVRQSRLRSGARVELLLKEPDVALMLGQPRAQHLHLAHHQRRQRLAHAPSEGGTRGVCSNGRRMRDSLGKLLRSARIDNAVGGAGAPERPIHVIHVNQLAHLGLARAVTK
eukprot:scaffold15998_cov111-Isochrysis_galbana.AAC.2